MNAGLGRHLLLECHDCAADLADGVALEALLRRAADAAGAHVLSAHMHPFGAGLGVTGVLLLRESHISAINRAESEAKARMFLHPLPYR